MEPTEPASTVPQHAQWRRTTTNPIIDLGGGRWPWRQSYSPRWQRAQLSAGSPHRSRNPRAGTPQRYRPSPPAHHSVNDWRGRRISRGPGVPHSPSQSSTVAPAFVCRTETKPRSRPRRYRSCSSRTICCSATPRAPSPLSRNDHRYIVALGSRETTDRYGDGQAGATHARRTLTEATTLLFPNGRVQL